MPSDGGEPVAGERFDQPLTGLVDQFDAESQISYTASLEGWMSDDRAPLSGVRVSRASLEVLEATTAAATGPSFAAARVTGLVLTVVFAFAGYGIVLWAAAKLLLDPTDEAAWFAGSFGLIFALAATPGALFHLDLARRLARRRG